MDSPLIPELLQDLGNIQVFHYATLADITAKLPPTKVYWQDKHTRATYGPFNFLHEALAHSIMLNSGRKPPKSNLIEVDFKTRKRKV